MFLEIAGLAVFSTVIGSLTSIESDKKAHMLIQEYIQDHELLMAEVSGKWPKTPMPKEFLDDHMFDIQVKLE